MLSIVFSLVSLTCIHRESAIYHYGPDWQPAILEETMANGLNELLLSLWSKVPSVTVIACDPRLWERFMLSTNNSACTLSTSFQCVLFTLFCWLLFYFWSFFTSLWSLVCFHNLNQWFFSPHTYQDQTGFLASSHESCVDKIGICLRLTLVACWLY